MRGRQGLLDSGGEEQLQSPILKAFVLHFLTALTYCLCVYELIVIIPSQYLQKKNNKNVYIVRAW